MAIDPILLSALVCPQSRDALDLASPELVGKLNEAIAGKRLTTQGGKRVEASFDAGLVRADGLVFYAIVDDIPNLLITESISLDQLG